MFHLGFQSMYSNFGRGKEPSTEKGFVHGDAWRAEPNQDDSRDQGRLTLVASSANVTRYQWRLTLPQVGESARRRWLAPKTPLGHPLAKPRTNHN